MGGMTKGKGVVGRKCLTVPCRSWTIHSGVASAVMAMIEALTRKEAIATWMVDGGILAVLCQLDRPGPHAPNGG